MSNENVEKPTLNFRVVGGWQINPVNGVYELNQPERFELYESNGGRVVAVTFLENPGRLIVKQLNGNVIMLSGFANLNANTIELITRLACLTNTYDSEENIKLINLMLKDLA